MNNYIKELADICGLPFGEIAKDTKVIALGTKILYISNYKKIISYSTSKIDLKVKKDVIHILGENLIIKQMDKGEMIVFGKINSFSVGDYV